MEQYGIVLLYSTRDAMAAEKTAKAKGLSVRIIGTPGTIKATCGFCLKYDMAHENALHDVLQKGAWQTEGWYHAVQTGLTVVYTPVKESSVL